MVGGVFPVTFQLLQMFACIIPFVSNFTRADFCTHIAYSLEYLLKEELDHLLKPFSK